MPLSNFELLKNSDPAALVKIHAQYNRSIFWVGKRWLDDEFVIETLVQDVFLKLWACRDRIETPKHIYFFLKFVMKRECFTYYSKPRNKFFRKIYSLDKYNNYQDYMIGDDPLNDYEHLRDHEVEQMKFDQIKRVLPMLSDKRKHLIELCLKYGFHYKAIGKVMGIGMTETSNEVKRAIEELKTIINRENALIDEQKCVNNEEKTLDVISEKQQRILELRFEKSHSFASIAERLNLSQKEVHKEFVAAYKLWQELEGKQLKSA